MKEENLTKTYKRAIPVEGFEIEMEIEKWFSCLSLEKSCR